MLFVKEAINFNFALHEKIKYSSKGLLFQGTFRSHAFNCCFFQSNPYKKKVFLVFCTCSGFHVLQNRKEQKLPSLIIFYVKIVLLFVGCLTIFYPLCKLPSERLGDCYGNSIR